MEAITAFIRALIKKPYDRSKAARKAFYQDPNTELNDFQHGGTGLSPEEKAVIISLDYRVISEYVGDPDLDREIRDFVNYNNGDFDWPDPGDPEWDPWANGRACGPRIGLGGNQRILWSGPQSKIIHVFRNQAAIGETFPLRIAGEGFLPGAIVMLKQIEAPYFEIRSQADDYIACTVRRTYLSASVSIPTGAAAGPYSLSVWNDGWKDHRLEWGKPFSIR